MHPINTMWLVWESIITIAQSCFVGFLSGSVESSQLIYIQQFEAFCLPVCQFDQLGVARMLL